MSCETSSDAPRDGETGTRTPALDERKGVRHDVQRDVSTPESCGELRPTSVPPVAEVRYKVQFTADQAYVDLLEEACSLLQHGLPGRDVLEVQRRALKLLVHELRQRKYAACERPCPKAAKPANDTPQPKCTLARPPELQSSTRAPRAALQSARDARQSTQQSARDARHFASQAMPHSGSSAGKSASQSRYIPAKVRRSVWKRDEARCAFVDARGQRCREQSGLEFHHQHPHARGGPPSAENIALRCRSHNALAAEQDFGRDVVREKRARKRERGAAEPRWRSARGVESSRAGAVPAESSPAVLAWCRERAEAIRAGAVPAESSPGAGAVP
jgi:5-methylcytosine-specific restriction endonuclease McrA